MTAIYSHALTEQYHVTIGFFLEQNTLFKLIGTIRGNRKENMNRSMSFFLSFFCKPKPEPSQHPILDKILSFVHPLFVLCT